MKHLASVLLAIVFVVIALQPGFAKELTFKDLALQAGAGVVGYFAVGYAGAAMTRFASPLSYETPPTCGLRSTPENPDWEVLNSICFISTLQMQSMQSLNAALAAGGVGSLSGVLLAAKTQGQDGNVFTASVGLLIAHLFVSYQTVILQKQLLTMTLVTIEGPLDSDGEPWLDKTDKMISDVMSKMPIIIVTPLIVTAAILLGYHLF